MILKIDQNTPVSAVQISDMDAVLVKFRIWKGYEFLTIEELYSFITTPSNEREVFLNTLNLSVSLSETTFATKTYI